MATTPMNTDEVPEQRDVAQVDVVARREPAGPEAGQHVEAHDHAERHVQQQIEEDGPDDRGIAVRGRIEAGAEQPQQLQAAEGEQAGAAEPDRELEAPGPALRSATTAQRISAGGQRSAAGRRARAGARSCSPTIGGGHSGRTVQKKK